MSAVIANLLRENPLVISGMGCVSACGQSVESLWDAVEAGQSLADWRTFGFGAQSRFAVCGAPELDFSNAELFKVRKMDRVVQMAWIAARQAWNQARLEGAYPRERIGVFVGSARGPLGKTFDSIQRLGQCRLMPSSGADSTFAALNGALSHGFELQGPGATISATCASAAFAIGFAAEQILLGKADAMLVGGAEALHPLVLEQLDSAGVLGSGEDARKICRPFDAARNGIVLGEGSAFLVLESASALARRNQKPLARLAGWSASLDNSGRTGVSENGCGLVRVMREALNLANLRSEQIGYINAHGTGTRLNDAAEAQAIKKLFGAHSATLPCTSTKPAIGHCLGATAALEAIITIEALRRQKIPPTANYSQPDPCCPINARPMLSKPVRFSSAMSNSLGFWGHHASIIFSTPFSK